MSTSKKLTFYFGSWILIWSWLIGSSVVCVLFGITARGGTYGDKCSFFWSWLLQAVITGFAAMVRFTTRPRQIARYKKRIMSKNNLILYFLIFVIYFTGIAVVIFLAQMPPSGKNAADQLVAFAPVSTVAQGVVIIIVNHLYSSSGS